jgi:hypothetical protein
MTITEAGAHIGERTVCALWDGSMTEGIIKAVIKGEVFVERPGHPGWFGGPEHMTLATEAADSARLF